MKIQIVRLSKDQPNSRQTLQVVEEIEDEHLFNANQKLREIQYQETYIVYQSLSQCHGFALFLPEIEVNMTDNPLPGDAVRATNNKYSGVIAGDFGVISGSLGKAESEYLVCFYPSSFRDNEIVICSDGPAPYIKSGSLSPAEETRLQLFWRWGRGYPRGGEGINFLAEVKVWGWAPV
jgi:hypothetical protein